jgi:hypothetical protein
MNEFWGSSTPTISRPSVVGSRSSAAHHRTDCEGYEEDQSDYHEPYTAEQAQSHIDQHQDGTPNRPSVEQYVDALDMAVGAAYGGDHIEVCSHQEIDGGVCTCGFDTAERLVREGRAIMKHDQGGR